MRLQEFRKILKLPSLQYVTVSGQEVMSNMLSRHICFPGVEKPFYNLRSVGRLL